MTITMIFHPADTLMFRDGRPFNQSDEGQARAHSMFPPTPETIAGAVRTVLARRLFGWVTGNWAKDDLLGTGDRHAAVFEGADQRTAKTRCETMVTLLGDGPQLGSLQVSGPFVYSTGSSVPPVMFPAPHFYYQTDEADYVRFAPCDVPLKTDHGDIRLLKPGTGLQSKLREMSGNYFAAGQICEALRGGSVSSRTATEVSEHELRVGLARNPKTRLAEPGLLYESSRIRLKPGLALAAEVGGLSECQENLLAQSGPSDLAFLGGESRFAFVEYRKGDLELHKIETIPLVAERYIAVLLTPARFKKMPKPQDIIAGLPGKLVAIACQRARQIGGFRSGLFSQANKPALPAGTTLFMEGNGGNSITEGQRRFLGEDTGFGYGRYVIGSW